MNDLFIRADEVRAAVSMNDAIEAVRGALTGMAAGQFEQPVRTVMGEGKFLVMSAHHRPSGTAMVKSLSLSFDREPAISGTVSWAELARPVALVADAAAITGLRTGAISGVATDLLAPIWAENMTIIGAGEQAADQVRAVRLVRNLRQVSIVGRNPERAKALANLLASEMPSADVRVCQSVEQAVTDADIVTCATPAETPLFDADMLKPRAHVNAIGSFRPTMRELPDDLLEQSTIFIDDLNAVLEESGEILHALASGAIAKRDLHVLGESLGTHPQPNGRTVFKSVGIAVQDWAIAQILAQRYLQPTD